MEQAVASQHAHPNTVYHCLYGYYTLGLSRDKLARLYCKSERTISNWIRVFETNGVFERAIASRTRKYSVVHREWLYRYYERRPLAYLDEAQGAFKQEFGFGISLSSVWRIIHELGLTWKVLERRAMHVKESDIFRFARELSAIDWSHQNLVFLDEVSFDNRGMLRKRGYSLKGTTVAIRGDFQRKPRVSLLAFIGVHGLLDYGDTEGTFDRAEFVRCCQDFAYSGRVKQYPGQNSVWILDGASIHRDPEIVHWLRSIGIVPIFLPAYCPFFNPIEFMFGYIKKSFQRHYLESSGRDLMPFVIESFQRFRQFNMARVFQHCGWMVEGHFDPSAPLSKEHRTAPDLGDTPSEDGGELGFGELEAEIIVPEINSRAELVLREGHTQ